MDTNTFNPDRPDNKILWKGDLLDAKATLFLSPEVQDQILFDVTGFDISIYGGVPFNSANKFTVNLSILSVLSAVKAQYLDAVMKDYQAYRTHGKLLQ